MIVKKGFLNIRTTDFDAKQLDNVEMRQLVKQVIGIDKKQVRTHVALNASFSTVFHSLRFQLEYAKQMGLTAKIPMGFWMKKQLKDGHFVYKNAIMGKEQKFEFSMADVLFYETRHGFSEIDAPLDAQSGVHSCQDPADCVSTVPIRNMFAITNTKVPILRLTTSMFCQKWVQIFLRPKFVFRGLLACPEGDYGIVKIGIHMMDGTEKITEHTISVSFKKNDEPDSQPKGKFIEFEVCSPEYQTTPNYIYVNAMVYHADESKRAVPGFRLANCTIQCVLPDHNIEFQQRNIGETPAKNEWLRRNLLPGLCGLRPDDTENQRNVYENFFRVFRNSEMLQDEETNRKQEEIENMLGGDLMGEKETRKRKDDNDNGAVLVDENKHDDEQPENKRRREDLEVAMD